MRIVVFSDSHGSLSCLDEVIQKNRTADMFIHLGDGSRELEDIQHLYPDYDIRGVKGNCDWGCSFPDMMIIDAGEAKVLATHGHIQNVRGGLETIKKTAIDNGAAVILFGHTHCRYEHYEDGLYFLNPGSIAQPRDCSIPSYGFVDITKQGIITNIVKI